MSPTREREQERDHEPETETRQGETYPECSDGGDIQYHTNDARTGETVCRDCGLVLDDTDVDHGPQWRTFSNGDTGTSERHSGSATTVTMHDRGLTTDID